MLVFKYGKCNFCVKTAFTWAFIAIYSPLTTDYYPLCCHCTPSDQQVRNRMPFTRAMFRNKKKKKVVGK